jgi:nucleotide-binding universal stress UspA family protein
LALKAAAEVIVLHVATPGDQRPTEPGTLVFPRYVDQPQHGWSTWAQEFLDRLRAIGRAKDDVKMRLAVAHGDAGSAIVDFARQSDLVVLGWRGVLESGHARTMRRVIHDSICPVIVFRLDHHSHR